MLACCRAATTRTSRRKRARVGVAALQDLQRHAASKPLVERAIDGGHATDGDRSLDPIAPEQRAGAEERGRRVVAEIGRGLVGRLRGIGGIRHGSAASLPEPKQLGDLDDEAPVIQKRKATAGGVSAVAPRRLEMVQRHRRLHLKARPKLHPASPTDLADCSTIETPACQGERARHRTLGRGREQELALRKTIDAWRNDDLRMALGILDVVDDDSPY